MSFDVRTADLPRLNSLTKYPSVPTYHALDPSNGNLLEEPADFGEGPVLLTEKIDGTNARVICAPDGDWIIGSRNDFLLARGDLIGDPALGIADALREVADRFCTTRTQGDDALLVFYGEVYGGKVGQASSEYTGAEQVGFRLFDVARLAGFEAVLEKPRHEISNWRENGGQSYLEEHALQQAAQDAAVELTPRLGEVRSLPEHVEDAAAFLEDTIPETRSALDEGAGGTPEGIVARTRDRSQIAKLRLSDYRRTLRRRER